MSEVDAPRLSSAVPAASNVVAASLATELITTHAGARALFEEWRALFVESGSRNPFSDPTWLLAWAEHFVADGDLFVVAVRDRGRLCCVAPFYRRRLAKARVALAQSVQLLGAVEHVVLTERPEILAQPSHYRRAMRSVLEVLQADATWDWAEVSMAAGQGWFEPAWIDPASPVKPFVVHKTSRPSVGLDLPADLDSLGSGIKRNLRESLRRGRNRLNRTGLEWDIEIVKDPSDFGAAIASAMSLHNARSSMADTIAHDDMFVAPRERAFVADVLLRMAREGSAEALFVRVDGVRVAGLVTLLAPDAVYFCFSGVDPEWWSFSAVTLLQWEAIRRAVEAGRTHADLSVGVDVAKLRWSESVAVHPEFFIVSGRRRSELAFGAYHLAATAARVLRERKRYPRLPRGAG